MSAPPRFTGTTGDFGFASDLEPDPAALSTAELVASRAYAFPASDGERAVAGCVESLRRYGFCVLDRVIPEAAVPAVHDELATVQRRLDAMPAEQRQRPGPNGRAASVNPLVLTPKYAEQLAQPVVAAVARSMLDSHVRIAMQNDRIILSDDDTPNGEPGGFGPIPNRGPDGREWHTFAAPLPSLLVASCC